MSNSHCLYIVVLRKTSSSSFLSHDDWRSPSSINLLYSVRVLGLHSVVPRTTSCATEFSPGRIFASSNFPTAQQASLDLHYLFISPYFIRVLQQDDTVLVDLLSQLSLLRDSAGLLEVDFQLLILTLLLFG